MIMNGTMLKNSANVSNLRRTRIVALGLALAAGALLMGNRSTSATRNQASPVESAAAASSGFHETARTAESGDDGLRRIVMVPEIDREHVESLQRWVGAGHDEWCKDARLVAAEEMRRLAADFSGSATALSVVNEDEDTTGDGAQVAVFEWVPEDGRAAYRVTVERFAWLLPIAGDGESVVWVPTQAEIWISEGEREFERIDRG
jgi:hypothetical protein